MDEVSAKFPHKECIVAHIDVLGAKKLIEEDEQKFIGTLKSIVDEAKILCEHFAKYSLKKQNYSVKIFSDNICFYAELPDLIEENKMDRWSAIMFFLCLINSFQYIATLRYKILLRGGIAKGNLYADQDFIIGTALIQAYQLESEKAIYSRIIISEDILNEDSQYASNKWFLKDTDGVYMLNYLVISQRPDEKELSANVLLAHKFLLLDKLIASKDKHVEAKILQIIHYHNRYYSNRQKIPEFAEFPTNDNIFITLSH